MTYTTKDEIHDYILSDLGLNNSRILDAATGAGQSTQYLAEYIHHHDVNSEIISIDCDLSKEWIAKLTTKLGPLSKYVNFSECNIFEMPFENKVFDVINCHDTLIFLNQPSLKITDALLEFKRVLKLSGTLIITSELAPEKDTDLLEWRRWNLSKAISCLLGRTWCDQMHYTELKSLLKILCFEIIDCKQFSARKNENIEDLVQEWKEMNIKRVQDFNYSNKLHDSIVEEMEQICSEIFNRGYLYSPSKYVIKCKKINSGIN